MLLLILGGVGCVAGAVLTLRHSDKVQNAEAGVTTTAARKAIKDGRRALFIGHTVVRAQLSRAFVSTARRYAPVPLTFSHVALANYIPIAATATGGTLIVIAFCRIAVSRLSSRPHDTAAQRQRAAAADKENVAVGAGEAVSGLLLYSAGKAAWLRGPLRGGLSVFGASPDLDRCASRERYLAEKLAEFSGAATGGAASLATLAGLGTGEDEIKEAVGAMARYAARGTRAQNLLVAPEVSEAWSEFALKVNEHRADMRGIAGKIYYPHVPGVRGREAHRALMVVNATDPVKRFAAGSRDSGAVLAQLLGDLGSARAGFVGAAASALLLGGAVGAEIANAMPWVRGFLGEHGGDRDAPRSVEVEANGRAGGGQHTQRRRIEMELRRGDAASGAAGGEARQRAREPAMTNAS